MAQAIRMEKVTFSLPANLVKQVRDVVGKGAFTSQNALVREAIKHELKRVREEEFVREMEEAARDALFIQDIEESMSDFANVDAETARLMSQDEESDGEL